MNHRIMYPADDSSIGAQQIIPVDDKSIVILIPLFKYFFQRIGVKE